MTTKMDGLTNYFKLRKEILYEIHMENNRNR